MKLKHNVTLLGIKNELLFGLVICDTIYQTIVGHGVTITSITDSLHSNTSLHYSGYAADLRTRDDDLSIQWSDNLKYRLIKALRGALTTDYDIILEDDHIHVEYQPKGK